MKRIRAGRIRVPRKLTSYAELADFFDRYDGTELLKQGIMQPDREREDLDRMLLEYHVAEASSRESKAAPRRRIP